MTERKISPKSLKNLYQSNKEANQLTKESIETALLFLLEKKELKQISVSELVRKAGVSRNAFYRNYKSKEEILDVLRNKNIEVLITLGAGDIENYVPQICELLNKQ